VKRYAYDPRWIQTRYANPCHQCGKQIDRRARAYWFPRTRSLFCETCGEEHDRRFQAEAWDEENNRCM